MLKISSDEFQRDVRRYQDAALEQPVAVAREGAVGTVLISEKEYARLKQRDRRVLRLEDFSDEDIAAIDASRPPPEAAAFDHELD